jgi:hypothetical protein
MTNINTIAIQQIKNNVPRPASIHGFTFFFGAPADVTGADCGATIG